MTASPPIANQKSQIANLRQRELALPIIGRHRPLCDPVEIKRRLDWSEDYVLAMIDNGALPWAWNIASQTSARRMLRVLARSIDNIEHRGRAQAHPSHPSYSFEQVADFILPHARPTLRATELMRAFNASSTHILDLLREGSLALSTLGSRPSTIKRGPNGSPEITRASVIAFLQSRRIE